MNFLEFSKCQQFVNINEISYPKARILVLWLAVFFVNIYFSSTRPEDQNAALLSLVITKPQSQNYI